MERSQRAELLARFERATELPLLALALTIIPLFLVPFFVDLSSTAETSFLAMDWTIWAVFAVELSIRVYLAEHRRSYLLAHWYDVLIVALPFLRPLRVVRSARALRLVRIGPYAVRASENVRHMLRQRGLQYVLVLGLLAVFGTAAMVYLAERGNGGTINGYDTALWWAVTTVTTVGYGDTYPVTAEGRAFGVVLMLVGISFFSWVTANIAAFLIEYGGRSGRSVTTADLMDKLESLESEVRALSQSARSRS